MFLHEAQVSTYRTCPESICTDCFDPSLQCINRCSYCFTIFLTKFASSSTTTFKVIIFKSTLCPTFYSSRIYAPFLLM